MEPENPSSRERSTWDWRHGLLGAFALILGITSLWYYEQLVATRRTTQTALLKSQERGQQLVGDAENRGKQVLVESRKAGALSQATAFAAAIQPIMTFRGQVPEITDRSVQAATRNLAQRGNYSFVAITNPAGRVIASSDLTIIGRDFKGTLQEGVAAVDGENQAVASIGGENVDAGWVIIRIRGAE